MRFDKFTQNRIKTRHIVIRQSARFGLLLALLTVTVLSTGCVTNGRRILLKEYSPSIVIPDNKMLAGSTICLKSFTCAPDLVEYKLTSKPEEPSPFSYVGLTKEQDRQWDSEMKALQKSTSQANWIKIGNMRNGFGMVLSHVYALNNPAEWMNNGLKFDLEAQGARVVDDSQAANADAVVSGLIKVCRADMYVTIGSTILVDLEVQPKNGAGRHKEIHTHGATAAMLASEGEYFHALRDARQKFSIIASREILQAVKAAQ